MTGLEDKIRRLIAAVGPISVADYMSLVLSDPEHGYYTTRTAIGLEGDFITAPEISQMFGELIGIWCVAAYEALGRPPKLILAELGPGRGTLMADLLRAGRVDPGFIRAAEVHLVEISPELRRRQAACLTGFASPVWHDRIDELPDGPLLVVANEFFDALPIRQFVLSERGWRERVVGLDEAGNLAFGIGAAAPDLALLPPGAGEADVGAVAEINRPAEAILATLAHRLVRHGGAALIFDYGHVKSGFGETLQAVRAHHYAEPLSEPGECDLTAHVDFDRLAQAAAAEGAAVLGPVTQGDFLIAMGLAERAGALGAGKSAADQQAIVAAVERLAGPEEMGTLFKAMAVTHPPIALSGF
ncbi:class I SAM-dependent methyltransferase [Pleomorphomonas carboxyditropha]|uniref:Methyltransferase n=1 Tax=Pleomorphomonas carboxyditropha TaxID=2023338 RepID=A0A2G9WQX9_9HYPH|nr:class I SAM-dependent methyltransferase [Pleomorphomonas carboxyditropha]PIO97129.1 methyltransferase [Pleomorphomonas carboxyditropha]